MTWAKDRFVYNNNSLFIIVLFDKTWFFLKNQTFFYMEIFLLIPKRTKTSIIPPSYALGSKIWDPWKISSKISKIHKSQISKSCIFISEMIDSYSWETLFGFGTIFFRDRVFWKSKKISQYFRNIYIFNPRDIFRQFGILRLC